jgi:hypothetical protein
MWLEEEYKNYVQNPGEEVSRETPVCKTEEVTDVLHYRKDSFFQTWGEGKEKNELKVVWMCEVSF